MALDPDPDGFAARLSGARAGNRGDWEHLYRSTSPAVLGYLRAQQPQRAEDVLAETWLQVVRDLARFDGDAGAFRGWVLRIAHNRLVDDRRAFARRMSEVSVAEPPDQVIDPDPAPPLDDPSDVARLFEGLPATQRAVLYLRFVLDLPQAEIADMLGSTVAAVKMQQRRGIDAIATRLEEARP